MTPGLDAQHVRPVWIRPASGAAMREASQALPSGQVSTASRSPASAPGG